MVGGQVIENRLDVSRETGSLRRILWCVDGRHHSDECAVFADAHEAEDVRPGDQIWWQGGKIYWTRKGLFVDREIRKIGFSFDPREAGE